jgi:hypothetical protein
MIVVTNFEKVGIFLRSLLYIHCQNNDLCTICSSVSFVIVEMVFAVLLHGS